MLRIKFSYLNLVDLDDPISGNYYFGAEAYDIDGHYWEPRIVDSFSIERFFDVEMDVSNRIRTISVSLDNGDKFFNKFAETGKTLLNSQMSLYYDDGQNKTKHFTGKVSKIDSFGTVVKLTLREIGYEYLENNFPDAQIAYDYYSENGINESWNCIPIHFGTVKSIPVSWVNSYESEYMIGSGPILNVKRIYIDEDDKEEKNLLYDSEAENPQKEYKANDDAKPIYVRIFKGFGYDADGHREVVIDDVGKEGEIPDPSDNKFHHESKWGGFAYIQLYSIDDDGYEIPAYPYTKDGGIGQLRVDIEGICELDEDSGDYVMVRNPAKIIKMMFVNPELVSEGECAIGWGYTENQVDFDQAIADCETLGYKIDGSFDSTMQFGEALKQICYHCRGYVVEESEKITLNIDMPKSVVGVPRFDDEGLHGDPCDLTEWSEPSVDEQINRVRLNYDWNLKTGKFDKKPSVNHQSPDWEQNQNYDNWLEDTEHAERIGKWNPQTVEFKMIRDCETAHRLAIYYLRKKSKQLIEAKIVVPSEKAMNLDAGDLIRVMSAQMDWYKETISVDANSGNETRIIDKTEGKLFQITQISKSEENTEISISEYDSSIFAADSATFTAYEVPAPVASKLLPMAPLSVILSAGYESGSDEFSANNVYVNGTIEYDSEGSKNYAVVQYADLGTTVPTQSDIETASYLTHGMITETTFRINYLMAGHYYAVRVYTANNYGNSSATLSSAILVSGNTNVPPAPTLSHTSETGQTIGYTLTGKTVKLRITLDSSDLSGELAQKFRIYRNGQFIKEELATYTEYQKTSSPLVYWGKYTADSIDLVEQYDASYSYYATCVSKWGIESLPSSTITFSTPEELDLDYVLETIENIQADQEEMDERLTAIASDDLITAGEKATIRKDWASVQAKYNKLHPVIIAEPYDFDANPLKSQYGTDYTAYETAYSALSTYLTNTIAINVNADVEGTGVVSALAEKFNDYVDNELKILADIDECNKLLAQTISLECDTTTATSAKTIVSPNLKIFDGLRVTVKFTNGNTSTDNFSLNFKHDSSDVNNLCGNQLYFKGSRITNILFDAGTSLTFVYDGTNDRWEASESTQLVWSENPSTNGIYDLTKLNGGKLYASSIESQSIKANAVTTEKLNAGAVTAVKIATDAVEADKIKANAVTTDKLDAGAVTTAKLDTGAVTSDKITSNAIIGKTFVTSDGVGTINSSTNKYVSGVKFDSNGITAWSEDGKTVEIKNDGSATLTGSITANSGYIGGWTVNANDLSSTDGKVVLNKNGTITLSNTINSVLNTITLDPTNGIKETSGSTVKFQLSQTGKLTATDAEISGKITATSGSIGGWTVGNSDLHNGNMYLDSTGNIRGNYNSTNNTGWRLNADGTANIGKLSVTSTGGISSNQFSIDGTTGDATFSGALSAASGSFSGSLSSASVDTNGLTIGTGTNQIKLNSTDGIKATNFQIATNGNVTMTGSVTATSGKIANWTIDGNDLKSSNLILDGANGAIKSNNYSTGTSGWQIKGDGTAEFVNATVSGNITASSGNIGGWTVNQTNLTSNNSKVVLANDGTITLNNASSSPTNIITIDPTNGIKETNNGTVKFQLSQAGKLTATDAEISGKITATDGSIGGWSIGTNTISSNGLILGGTDGTIKSSNFTTGDNGTGWQIKGDGTAEFNGVVARGTIKSNSGIIGGWTINSNGLSSLGINISSQGSINGGSYVSGISGWSIDSTGNAEFNSATIRGAIKSAVFEYDKVSAVGGQMLVKKASITVSYAHTSTSLKVKDAIHFSVGDLFVVKKDATNVFCGLISAKTENADGTGILTYSIPDGGGSFFSPNNGQSVVNYGNVNSGGVLIDGDKPYIDIFKNKTNPNMFNPILNLSAKNSTTASIAQENGVIDVSGNGNNGRAYGGVAIINDNEVGQCYSFDGINDYISIPDDNNIFFSRNYLTIIFNVKTTDFGQILCKSKTFNNGLRIRINKKIQVIKNGHAYTSNTIVNNNLWHSCAIVISTSEIIFYIDGKLDNSLNWNFSPLVDDFSKIYLGCSGYSLSSSREEFLDGLISDVRIYPRALTADEVKMLYAQATNKHVLSNGNIQLDHIARMGNLNGVADISTDLYGLFIGDKSIKQYLQYDSDNGLQIGGDVKIESGVPLNKLDIVRQWQMDDNSTYINGGKIYANSITSAQLASDAIQSTGYTLGDDGFSTTGSLFNLANGSIVTPSFRIDADGTAHFKNNVSIQSNDVSTNTLDVNGNSNFGGNLLPKYTETYDIGSSTYKWKDAYINNIHGTVDDVKETAINVPSGEILCLSPNGCTTASIALENGVIDVSGNGNHGRAYNGVTIVNDSEIGLCYSANGSENKYIGFGNLTLPTTCTLHARIKLISYVSYSGVISWRDNSHGIILSVRGSDKKAYIGDRLSGSDWSLYSSSQIPLNTWITLTGVFSANKSIIYINGNKDAESNNIIISTGESPLYVMGRLGGSIVDIPNGLISDVRIYPYALTPTQVKSLYMISKNTQNVESLRRLNDFHLATDTQIDNLFT